MQYRSEERKEAWAKNCTELDLTTQQPLTFLVKEIPELPWGGSEWNTLNKLSILLIEWNRMKSPVFLDKWIQTARLKWQSSHHKEVRAYLPNCLVCTNDGLCLSLRLPHLRWLKQGEIEYTEASSSPSTTNLLLLLSLIYSLAILFLWVLLYLSLVYLLFIGANASFKTKENLKELDDITRQG
jgi:hypothetical protein